jgi:hypothetical protein
VVLSASVFHDTLPANASDLFAFVG